MAAMRILAVSDNPLARAGMADTLGEAGVEVVGVTSRAGASTLAATSSPDAVVVDLTGADPTLLDWLSDLAAGFPGIPLVGVGDPVEGALAAVGAGAVAVLPTEAGGAAVAAAVRSAEFGLVTVGREELGPALAS